MNKLKLIFLTIIINSTSLHAFECLNLTDPQNHAIPSAAGTLTNPLIFVTQQPLASDFNVGTSTFGNHVPMTENAGRGGDVFMLYPPGYEQFANGCLRNLTAELGLGIQSPQQMGPASLAVRSPSLNWTATCFLVSIVEGSPSQLFDYSQNGGKWQLHEVCGLGPNDTLSINKVPNQHPGFNYVEGIYGVHPNEIIVITDIPRNGAQATHLYPTLDEYDRAPTTTGLWNLNTVTGKLKLIFNSPSGVFDPMIDSFGRILFSSWDHLEQDLFIDHIPAVAFDWSSEAADAFILSNVVEYFPEARGNETDLLESPYGNLSSFNMKTFLTWELDAYTFERAETINHIGRHEVSSYVWQSFQDDTALVPLSRSPELSVHMLRTKENPLSPGEYYFIDAPHFGNQGSGRVYKMQGEPGRSPSQMPVQQVSEYSRLFPNPPDANNNCNNNPNDGNNTYGGKFRDILPTAGGALVGTHSYSNIRLYQGQCSDYTYNMATPDMTPNLQPNFNFQLRLLKELNDSSGLFEAGDPITPNITRQITHWGNGDGLYTSQGHVTITFNGPMWQLDPIEVIPRPIPTQKNVQLPQPESQIFTDTNTDLQTFKQFLKSSDLALIVSRNVTTRDSIDKQQPQNLSVPNGTTTHGNPNGNTYDVSHFQIFQADYVRDNINKPGRAAKPVPLYSKQNFSQPLTSVPNNEFEKSYFQIAADGSMAALVPASRALTWQLTDTNGHGVVKERVWLTMQPGEIRVCASCHGVNDTDQSGAPEPSNPPEALRTLLNYWQNNDLIFIDGFEASQQ